MKPFGLIDNLLSIAAIGFFLVAYAAMEMYLDYGRWEALTASIVMILLSVGSFVVKANLKE